MTQTATNTTTPLTDIPISVVQEFGVGLYSRWTRTANDALLIVVRRQCGERTDLCNQLTILDVRNEVTTEVHPQNWIEWIKQRKITKVYKR